MRYLGTRNISEISAVKVFRILGYDTYIPDIYNNPISFLNNGCPLWIEYNLEGDCEIYEITNRDRIRIEIAEIIKRNYPRRQGIYCCHLNRAIQNYYKLESTDDYGLNSVCFDEDNNVKAILTFDKYLEQSCREQRNCAYISNIICNDEQSLIELWRYVTSDYFIKKHRGLLISYTQDRNNYGELLELTQLEDDKFYYQFE